MKKEGIHELYFPDDATNGALSVLATPKVQEMVEALLIAGANPKTISTAVASRFGVTHAEMVYVADKALFWNVDLLDAVSMRALIDFQADDCARHVSEEVRAQHRAVRRAHRHDPRRLAACLPMGHVCSQTVALKLGVWPAKLNVKNMRVGNSNAHCGVE